MKELVTLRKKPMKNGGWSLFLDYTVNGVRFKDYLKMYIKPEKNKVDRIVNDETMKAAQAMKAKKVIEIQNGQAGIKRVKRKDMLLCEYLSEREQEYLEKGSTEYSKNIRKLINHLDNPKCSRGRVSLPSIDRTYICTFLKSMKDNGMKGSTINTMYQLLGTQLRYAQRLELIAVHPYSLLFKEDKPRVEEAEREYLTLEELRLMVHTECKSDMVVKAFMFSCFTGLRISDIENLTWDMIRKTDSGYEVAERMQKTKAYIYVPLSQNAMRWLPEKRVRDNHVFKMPARVSVNETLRAWVKRAGINKHISFHCGRHTCATLLLTSDVDIYTVSKILGHRDIATTQIYAKIVDKKRVEAVNKVPEL